MPSKVIDQSPYSPPSVKLAVTGRRSANGAVSRKLQITAYRRDYWRPRISVLTFPALTPRNGSSSAG